MTAPDEDDRRLFEWLALRRVHDGGVFLVEGRYVQHRRVVVGHVANAITSLIEGGCLALGTPDHRGSRAVCFTVTGQFRYVELQHESRDPR